MMVSTILLLSGAQAAEAEPDFSGDVILAEQGQAHRGRGPHRHPRPKPKPRRVRRASGAEVGPWRHTGMLTTSALYGDENGGEATPWVSLSYQAEVPNGPMSIAAHGGLTAVGNYAELLDVGMHGRYYLAGGFVGGIFAGPSLTGSVSLTEGQDWAVLRPGLTAGAKQILPGGLSVGMRFIGEFIPLDTGPLVHYGISFGIGASTR